MENHNHLPILIAFMVPGQKVNLQVLRNKKKINVEVILKKWGDDDSSGNFLGEDDNPTSKRATPESNKQTAKKLGMKVTAITNSVRKAFKLKATGGVQVVSTKADGPARGNGVRSGDIILSVNQTDVKSVAHFHKLIAKIPSGSHVLFRIKRQNNALFIAFTVK